MLCLLVYFIIYIYNYYGKVVRDGDPPFHPWLGWLYEPPTHLFLCSTDSVSAQILTSCRCAVMVIKLNTFIMEYAEKEQT